MQPAVLRALEFDRIVDAVRARAETPMGAERLGRLVPSTDAQKVAQQLSATTEAVGYLVANGSFPLRSSADLPQILDSLAVEGRLLEPLHLLALASFLESVADTRQAIRRSAASFPQLDQVSAGAATFAQEIAATRDAIDPSGEVLDQASPELKMIRERLRKQRGRLRGTLESYLRGKDTAKHLQEQVVTERNGRYVIIVKAEHRGSIPGIVHGTSASGASLFLEPLSTVEINNDIVALEEQEQAEVRRILLALTDRYRARALDVHRTIETATELDVRQARARFSQSIDGAEPALSTDGAFELQAARHPLLKSAVPVTIRIVPPATSLLITGPNTGGKTVALKTAGLLALMAQAGLRIPAADGSRVPVFRSMFADIGDEQSIDASLSTFSGHITNIASMDRQLAMPALVLLDEVGSGTDPIEGGALGVAVVDHFRRRGATVIATSHYDALKTYASTTEHVISAAFGFEADTYAPTYQLIYGSPGRSLAMEIASRLGLSPSIIEAARRNVSAREAQLAEHLAQIDRDMRALDENQRLVAKDRAALDSAAADMRQREESLKQREEGSKRRLQDEVDAQVRKARKEIDDVIAELRTKAGVLVRDAARQPLNTGAAGAARSDARAAVDAVARTVTDGPAVPQQAAPITDGRLPRVGDRVIVAGLGLEGVVSLIHADAAEVDVRGKRMRASVRDLRVVGGAPSEPPRVKVNVDLQPRDTSPSDLNVIGCTVDEALTRTERFLDEILLGDHRTVRLIHGYGTGQLRRALAGYLERHPLVERFASAPPEQGGGGVTVVELKD